MWIRRHWAVIVLIANVTVVGCGKPKFQLAPVSGACLCNGEPIPTGLVVFEPIPEPGTDLKESGRSASGMIEPDGTYVLSTYKGTDGAIVGRHRVMVFAPALEDDDAPLTDANRWACGNAPLEETVSLGENVIDLELEFTPLKQATRRK